MAKKDTIPTEEYTVRVWRSGQSVYSVTTSKDVGGEREVTRKVVPTAERAAEIACDFLSKAESRLI